MMYILLVLQNVLTSGFSKCTYFWFCKMYILLLYTILDCNMYLLLMYTILVFQNVHTSDVHNSAPPKILPFQLEKEAPPPFNPLCWSLARIYHIPPAPLIHLLGNLLASSFQLVYNKSKYFQCLPIHQYHVSIDNENSGKHP